MTAAPLARGSRCGAALYITGGEAALVRGRPWPGRSLSGPSSSGRGESGSRSCSASPRAVSVAPFPCSRFPDGGDLVALFLARRGPPRNVSISAGFAPSPPPALRFDPRAAAPPPRSRVFVYTSGSRAGRPGPAPGPTDHAPRDVTGRGRGGGAPRAGWERCWGRRESPPLPSGPRTGSVLQNALLESLCFAG